MPIRQLRRVRWAVRAALTLGVAASVAANVLHAEQNPIAQTIAAWPPLALLLNVELISRVPMHRRHLAVIRLVATAAIAGIAAFVSYWHMVAVAARYGEVGSVPFLLPISVDGLVIVASVSLVELAGRIREMEQARERLLGTPATDTGPAQGAQRPPAGTVSATAGTAWLPGVPAGAPATVSAITPGTVSAGADGTVDAASTAYGTGTANGATANGPSYAGVLHGVPANGNRAASGPATGPVGGNVGHGDRARTEQRIGALGLPSSAVGTPSGRAVAARSTGGSSRPRSGTVTGTPARGGAAPARPAGSTRPTRGRPVAETVRLARQLAAEQPGATDDDVARQLGISTRRLRTVLAEANAPA